MSINSFHHRGADWLAEGLCAVAWAEDGLIEAVEGTACPGVFGVQWRRERGVAGRPGDQRNPEARLFREMVAAAARGR